MPDLSVVWRDWGHRLTFGDDLLQFEVVDRNQVMLRSAAVSGLYRLIQDERGHPPDWQVLPLSCFAVTGPWTPSRLAEGTRSGRTAAFMYRHSGQRSSRCGQPQRSPTPPPTPATRSTTTSSSPLVRT